MISIPIISSFDDKGIKSAVREFKQLETVGQKAQFAIKKAAVPAAAALGAVTAVIGDSVKAAIEDQAAQAGLARQIKASTGATDAQVQSVESYISSLAKSAAISDDEARPAFQKLVVATKDVTKATELMNLATDVAAATGKPLVDVSEALSKGYAGNMKALGALSPEIKAMIKDGASLADVQKVLEANFGGAGEAAANTAAGGMKKLGIAFGETKESIGQAFLPIMEKLLPVVQKFSDWAEKNPELLAAVIAGMGILAGSILAVNAAMMLNPAVAITAGILALGAAVIYAYKKFEGFREVVRVVVNAMAGYIEGMVNGFIKAISQSGVLNLWSSPIKVKNSYSFAYFLAATLTGNATITMPTATAGRSFILLLKQDATGSRTVTWSTVKWPAGTAPTITATASKQDIFSFVADGTNWYGAVGGQNYTV